MLKKALLAAVLTMISGVALAHGYPRPYYRPYVRHYYPVIVPAAPAVIIPAPRLIVRLRLPL